MFHNFTQTKPASETVNTLAIGVALPTGKDDLTHVLGFGTNVRLEDAIKASCKDRADGDVRYESLDGVLRALHVTDEVIVIATDAKASGVDSEAQWIPNLEAGRPTGRYYAKVVLHDEEGREWRFMASRGDADGRIYFNPSRAPVKAPAVAEGMDANAFFAAVAQG